MQEKLTNPLIDINRTSKQHIDNIDESSFNNTLMECLNQFKFEEFSDSEEDKNLEDDLMNEKSSPQDISLHARVYREKVDIRQMPQRLENIEPYTCVTSGDGHGHTMKIIYTLVKHGIITNMTEQWYNRLYMLFNISVPFLKKEAFNEFLEILSKLTFNPTLYYRSIGDDVADRINGLDYYTISLYKQMKINGVFFEIVTSNHGQEIIYATELQAHDPYKEVLFKEREIASGYAKSMTNLEWIIKKRFVSRTEVYNLINEFYKPFLKAMSYAVVEKTMIFFTHAPFGLNDIKALGERLCVGSRYSDLCPSDIGEYINKINVQFKKHVQANTVFSLYEKINFAPEDDLSFTPYLKLIWGRCYDNLDRPIEKNGYSFIFVNGHDLGEMNFSNVVELDNDLGKTMYDSKGEYKVYLTREENFAKRNQMDFLAIQSNEENNFLKSPLISFEQEKEINLFFSQSEFNIQFDFKNDSNQIVDMQTKPGRILPSQRPQSPHYKLSFFYSTNWVESFQNTPCFEASSSDEETKTL